MQSSSNTRLGRVLVCLIVLAALTLSRYAPGQTITNVMWWIGMVLVVLGTLQNVKD